MLKDAKRDPWNIYWHEIFLFLLGSLFYTSPQGDFCMLNQPTSSTVALLGHVTHVPVKEGLQSIIKCLKNQDLTFSSRESKHSCISSSKKSASISIFHISTNECGYKLSYYNELNAQCQRIHYYTFHMFRSLIIIIMKTIYQSISTKREVQQNF